MRKKEIEKKRELERERAKWFFSVTRDRPSPGLLRSFRALSPIETRLNSRPVPESASRERRRERSLGEIASQWRSAVKHCKAACHVRGFHSLCFPLFLSLFSRLCSTHRGPSSRRSLALSRGKERRRELRGNRKGEKERRENKLEASSRFRSRRQPKTGREGGSLGARVFRLGFFFPSFSDQNFSRSPRRCIDSRSSTP